jgi:uncharacterized protein (DUF1330 family)
LLKFKERAECNDGRDTNPSGREAYMKYGRAVGDLLPKFGGRAVFVGDVTFLSLGQVEDLWDDVAIAMYPDRASMVRMSLSEEWRAISVHRSAGLKVNSTSKPSRQRAPRGRRGWQDCSRRADQV